jgi:hypothetical protein
LSFAGTAPWGRPRKWAAKIEKNNRKKARGGRKNESLEEERKDEGERA